jgi:hypothetical protein
VFAIACGYEDADDLDALRDDPGFRLVLGKLPGSGAGLASQPTMSRWKNAPTTRELARMLAAMIDIYCGSYPAVPGAVTLDIDDTCDVVHGYQQLSFWTLGMDIRYVVTSLTEGSAEHIYDTLYCARGQAENLIKRHKTQLVSDRTSCRSANANQMRLILDTAAYWLLWRIRQDIPTAAARNTTSLVNTEFATLRLRLLKVADRVIESPTRIRIAFASAYPDARVFKAIAAGLRPAPT